MVYKSTQSCFRSHFEIPPCLKVQWRPVARFLKVINETINKNAFDFARNAPKWLQINSKCLQGISSFEIVFERNGGCKIFKVISPFNQLMAPLGAIIAYYTCY